MYKIEKINSHNGHRSHVGDFRLRSHAEDHLQELYADDDIPVYDDMGDLKKIIKGEVEFEIVKG